MAKEKEKPFLMRELTIGERVALGQVTHMPGFQVIVKLIEAGCNEAVASEVRTDPEEENYNRILEARHMYARSVNKFTQLLRESINFHVQHGMVEEQQAKVVEAVEAK